jgi:hypothetical protein
MDLTNKEIDVEFMSSNLITGETIITVSISAEVMEGIMQRIGTYKLSFVGETFTSTTDSRLLVALQEKLEGLPEPVGL